MIDSGKSKPYSSEEWTEIIRPQSSLLHLGLRELWKYRDLIVLFVRRDFVSVYKQTILGPLWHIIQPLFTTIIFTFVFGNIAKLSTEGAPGFIFYMSGITMWSYFSHILTSTANTFVNNASIFGKVYFPRLTVPVSIAISALISFFIQFCLFVVFYIWFKLNGANVSPNIYLLAMPWFFLIMILWSLGLGLIASSMTSKYKDLRHAIIFGIQFYMFVSPVIYPVSSVSEDIKKLVMLNPIAPVLEGFRYAILGTGEYSFNYLALATITSLIVFFLGLMMFNKVEKTFMDTV